MSSLDHESFYNRIISLQKAGNDLNELFDENILMDSMKINWVLKKCVKLHNISVINFLLSQGITLGILNEQNQTVIHFAVYSKNYEAIDHLFRHFDNSINYTDDRGLSHLHAACIVGNIDVVEKLIGNGADVNGSFHYRSRNLGSLHLAAKFKQIEVVKILLKHGAEPNQLCIFNGSPLHEISRGNLTEIEQIISLLISKKKGNWDVYHRLYTLKKNYEQEIVIKKVLIDQGSDVNLRHPSGDTPINCIFKINRFKNVKKICPQYVYHLYRLESIVKELRNRQKKKVELLLSEGADVTIANNDGNTVLHLAVNSMKEFRQPPCLEAMHLADDILVEIIKKILERGANVNAKNNKGQTPLQLAVSQLSIKAVKTLLDYNAEASTIQFNNIHYSKDIVPYFQTTENVINIISALESKGLQLDQRNNLRILKFFVSNNSKYSFAISNEKEAYYKIKNLLELGTDLNIKLGLEKFFQNTLTNNDETKIDKLKRQTANQLFKHLMILEYVHLYSNEEIKDTLRCRLTSLNLDLSNEKKIPAHIKRELIDMDRIMLSPGISFRQILTISPQRCYWRIRSGDYMYVLSSEGFKNQFCNTLGIVEGHFAKTLIRKYVAESARDYLATLINLSLPDECCDQIFNYLDNESLFNLCSAAVDSDRTLDR